ncbi:hypothetical protein IHE31_00360 (plasmid) [Mycetohabitans rhizoxinica]|uniref:hypothetical protein n=1 Tax=Mycetohabitans rhizoxinica TaxID=412963 RepID=UPI0030CDDB7E
MPGKPMRRSMPQVAAFVDALRAAFGDVEIDSMIARGLAGEPVFYAQEGGESIGTPAPCSSEGWRGTGLAARHYCPDCSGDCVGTARRCIKP